MPAQLSVYRTLKTFGGTPPIDVLKLAEIIKDTVEAYNIQVLDLYKNGQRVYLHLSDRIPADPGEAYHELELITGSQVP